MPPSSSSTAQLSSLPPLAKLGSRHHTAPCGSAYGRGERGLGPLRVVEAGLLSPSRPEKRCLVAVVAIVDVKLGGDLQGMGNACSDGVQGRDKFVERPDAELDCTVRDNKDKSRPTDCCDTGDDNDG